MPETPDVCAFSSTGWRSTISIRARAARSISARCSSGRSSRSRWSAAPTSCACTAAAGPCERTTTSTRIDVLTGDQRTNLYRAFFGKRYQHGELLQVGGQSYGTSSDPAVGGGNELALFARLGWANKDWSVDGYYHARGPRRAICAQQDFGNTLLEPAIPEQDRTRADMYFRAGHGNPDSGVWAQAMVAHSNFTEKLALQQRSPDLPADSADTTRTSTQYIATGGFTRWGLRLSGVERYHQLQTGGVSATEVRASFEHRLLALSLYAERRGGDSSCTEEATARLTPLPFFAVAGTVARRHGGTAFGDEDEVSARLEAGLKLPPGLVLRGHLATRAGGRAGTHRVRHDVSHASPRSRPRARS